VLALRISKVLGPNLEYFTSFHNLQHPQSSSMGYITHAVGKVHLKCKNQSKSKKLHLCLTIINNNKAVKLCLYENTVIHRDS
jgi:hypothetical protein